MRGRYMLGISTLHSQVVQSTGNVHHEVITPGFRISEEIFDNATPCTPRNTMFNDNPDAGDEGILCFLVRRQVVPSRFFLRLKGHDSLRLIAVKACLFEQGNLVGKREGFVIGDLFVMPFAFRGLAHVIDRASDDPTHYEILDRMGFFLPL